MAGSDVSDHSDQATDVGRTPADLGGTVRVLHPLRLDDGPTGQGAGRGLHVGVGIDVETTGLDVNTGRIIQLAIRRFRYDAAGVVTDVDEPFEWLEDPGEPLHPDISALTGLTDADLAGREIEGDAATRLLRSASFVVAWNASFDRAWVERRLPGATGLNWCCPMRQVDWRRRGFDGRTLGYVLLQNGYYFCGHRASADVDAMIQMLRHEDAAGRTALSEMIETGSKPTCIVRARGAHFDLKDRLKGRGYRWDAAPDRRVWWREIADADLVAEQFWLAAHVYAADARPQKLSPEIVRVTPRTRFL